MPLIRRRRFGGDEPRFFGRHLQRWQVNVPLKTGTLTLIYDNVSLSIGSLPHL